MPEATRGMQNYKWRTPANLIYNFISNPKSISIHLIAHERRYYSACAAAPPSSLGLGADIIFLVAHRPLPWQTSCTATPIYSEL
jgi:hypothetical protein